MKKTILPLLLLLIVSGCNSSDDITTDTPLTPGTTMYFPENGTNVWEEESMTDLDWNLMAMPDLLDFLTEKNTKSFMILVNGRIVTENYFDSHTASSAWYWASAGKTLTAAMVGIAEQEGYLSINDKVSDYLNTGWTSASIEQENLITCRHLLTMTSGLDDSLGDDVSPVNLQYKADAGSRWAYHNVYVKLQDVVEQATGETWNSYFNSKLRDRIGMTGAWLASGDDLSVYTSNTRSMARFGLLALNNGKWKDSQIVNSNYFTSAATTSQNINKAYGYLWWLNGKESYHLPQTQAEFNGSIIPNAPADMFMALGLNDQKIYVVPSKKMVVIRMGNAADGQNFALSGFDNDLWEKINAVIN